MILRRTHPPLSYLPSNDPPKRTYNAENTARFIRNYRAVASGFTNALYIQSLRSATWLCPHCDYSNRNKDMNDLYGSSLNYCRKCGEVYTYNEILLGQEMLAGREYLRGRRE